MAVVFSSTYALSDSLCQHIMEQVADAIVVTDRRGVILHVNGQALRLFNRSRSALVGASCYSLVPEPEYQLLERTMARLNDGLPVLQELAVLSGGGEPVQVEVSATRVVDASTDSIVLVGVFRNIESRLAEESRRLSREKKQREVLVREVHHRIKNHLQALVGLISRETGRHPDAQAVFSHVMTQINSIAVVHGLQGSTGNEAVNLCDMVMSMCQVNEQVRGLSGRLKPVVCIPSPAVVSETECVPIALLLNELISNAMKHSPDDAASVDVEVSGNPSTGVARVTIRNQGQLPPELDLSDATDLSSGLGLVQALLPSKGARFTLSNDVSGRYVLTCLELEEPIVSMGKPCG